MIRLMLVSVDIEIQKLFALRVLSRVRNGLVALSPRSWARTASTSTCIAILQPLPLAGSSLQVLLISGADDGHEDGGDDVGIAVGGVSRPCWVEARCSWASVMWQ